MSDRAASPPTARVVTVLNVVAEAPNPLGLTEIARKSGCSTSTCAQILTELIAAGWVARDDRKRHFLGTGLIPLASAVRSRYPANAAIDVLTALHDEFDCEASLSRYDATSMTKLASVGAATPATLGTTLPLTPPIGIAGQALLTEELFEAWLGDSDAKLGDARKKALRSIAKFVRSNGWAAWRLADSPDLMLGAIRAAMPASLSESERETALAEVKRVTTVATGGLITTDDLEGPGKLSVAYIIAPIDIQPRYQIELHVLDPAMSKARGRKAVKRLKEAASHIAAAS